MLLSVAVKLTRYVWPAWLFAGLKVNVPVDGSKVMPEVRPVAERMTAPPDPDESLPVMVKWMFPPTVAFCGPGTVIEGRTFAERSVITTKVCEVAKPSSTVKLIV